MDSLSAGAFQEVINAGNDKQFVAMLLQMDEALVGVYHLLQVDILLHDVGKGIFGVIFFIHADDFFQGHFGLHHNGGEDAAREVAAVGDEVNAIAPGFFLTEQNRALLTNPDGSYTERGQDVIRQTPFGRMGRAEELCGTIQYLISDASSFVTGTVAVVDGGFNAFAM